MSWEDQLLTETNEEYHGKSNQYLSSHRLATFRWCQRVFKDEIDGNRPGQGEKQYFTFGSAFHTLVLEGKTTFDVEYSISSGPINHTTGKPFGEKTNAYKEWQRSNEQRGIKNVTEDEWQLIQIMSKSIWDNEAASNLLLGCKYRERVVRSTYCGTPCQAKIDAMGMDIGIIDLKTCRSLDRFIYDVRDFHYVEQLAFYLGVLTSAEIPVNYAAYLIAVEKNYPYRCGVWGVIEQDLVLSARQNEHEIGKLQQAIATNTWETGYEQVRTQSFF